MYFMLSSTTRPIKKFDPFVVVLDPVSGVSTSSIRRRESTTAGSASSQWPSCTTSTPSSFAAFSTRSRRTGSPSGLPWTTYVTSSTSWIWSYGCVQVMHIGNFSLQMFKTDFRTDLWDPVRWMRWVSELPAQLTQSQVSTGGCAMVKINWKDLRSANR